MNADAVRVAAARNLAAAAASPNATVAVPPWVAVIAATMPMMRKPFGIVTRLIVSPDACAAKV